MTNMMKCILFLSLGIANAFVATPCKLQTMSLRSSLVNEEENTGIVEAVEEVVQAVELPKLPEPEPEPEFDITQLPGVTAPFGFFDPLGLTNGMSKARVMYFREAEIKHSRVAMLAALGFPLAEKFHPLFGGNIDTPSYLAFQQTPLQTYWALVVLYIGVIEVFSVFTFKSPFENGALWTIKPEHKAGDFDWDPLDYRPTDPAEYKEIQTKELNNGRLAMIGIAGMVVQELVSGKALF